MSIQNNHLPQFNNPPVVEMALSVSFDHLEKLRNLQIAELWMDYKQRFPKSEEQPPRELPVERFEMAPVSPQVQLQLTNLPPVSRFLFLNETGTQLIQVQQDLFGQNWRKIGTKENYPRYENIRVQFQANLEAFCRYLKKQDLGAFVPKQCEVAYVNHIDAGDAWEGFHEIGKVFTSQVTGYSDSFLSAPETRSFLETHVIKDFAGKAVGRLRIMAEPAFQLETQKPVLKLTIVARGRPFDESPDGVLDFMDLGRAWVVRSFASVTQPEMHKVWQRSS